MEAHAVTQKTQLAGRFSLRLPLLGDEHLARLAGSGSEPAFAVLYERYHQQLYRYCRLIVRDDHDAQDALQSAFAGALSALQRGQRDAPLRPWLYRIAHNEAVSLLRRRRPQAELSEAHDRSERSAEEDAEERARLAMVVSDLRALPDRQRGALVMRELSGLSHEEIAVALGGSAGAVKQTIFEARRALQEFEEGRAMVCEDVRRLVSDGDGRSLRGRRVRAHLRDCSGCAVFAAAIPARQEALQALAPPLPAAAAGGLLASLLGGSGHTGGGSAVAVGVASKTASAGLVKLAIGAAVVATAGAGVTKVVVDSSKSPVAPAKVSGRGAGALTAPGTVTQHGVSLAPGSAARGLGQPGVQPGLSPRAGAARVGRGHGAAGFGSSASSSAVARGGAATSTSSAGGVSSSTSSASGHGSVQGAKSSSRGRSGTSRAGGQGAARAPGHASSKPHGSSVTGKAVRPRHLTGVAAGSGNAATGVGLKAPPATAQRQGVTIGPRCPPSLMPEKCLGP